MGIGKQNTGLSEPLSGHLAGEINITKNPHMAGSLYYQ